MSHLPVIVGAGGISAAGRSSAHHAYRRLVIDRLPAEQAAATLANLAVLQGMLQYRDGVSRDAAGNAVNLDAFLHQHRDAILAGTLIRKLEKNLFDCEQLRWHRNASLTPAEGGEVLRFTLSRRHLPETIPQNWRVEEDGTGQTVTVTAYGGLEVLFKDYHQSPVKSAGQLPSGFMPERLYPSRNHPRGLQMTVYGASDAIRSLGIDWETIAARVPPDQIAVYAGSSMSQLDQNGNGGMLQARLLGKKVTSKQLPLGFPEMPADFINAYMLGNVGTTGANMGACATFHYNLFQGIRDIQNGTHRVVIVGGSEAPLVPEIIEGYANMGALADIDKLSALDGGRGEPDWRRASRPFGENVGFTLAESAQFIVLFDDALALELGANILGAVNDVFINADGYKKSIAGPGIGNYITMAKAAAATRAVIGEEGLRRRTFVQAHGTSTPQNRVTESAIFSRIAQHFGIESWPVTAVKAHLGHSLCCAGADQLAASLGVWEYGIIPGITTTKAVAPDVIQENLSFLLDHHEVGAEGMDAAILNAKGFGGNNATASILAPHVARRMLVRRHGRRALTAHAERNARVAEASAGYDAQTCREEVPPIYRFDHHVKSEEALSFSRESLTIDGYPEPINLALDNKYSDMSD